MISLQKLIIGTLVIGGTASLLYAGPDDGLGGGGDATLTAPASKTGELSPAEMSASADDLMSNMHGMLRHVTQLREKAAKDKDIIKLNCVNDKLMPMKAQVNLAEASRRMLAQMAGNSDDSGRYAAYADVTTSADKVKDLRDEADACIGDALTYVGKTDVQVTGPNNPLLPPESGFGGGIEPPVYKTPYD